MTNTALSIRLNLTRPMLQVMAAGSRQTKLLWPNWSSFVLECSTNLQSTNAWTTVTDAPSIVNGQKVLARAAGASSEFFRLRK